MNNDNTETGIGLHADVELKPLGELIPYSNNPKEHPEDQVKKIASSIKNYSWDQPIVVDGNDEIIKGHGRMQAAELLGLDEVPVIERPDLTEAEVKAARIADNKTAEAPWDDELLSVELEQIEEDLPAKSFGFGDDELEDLLDSVMDDTIDELSEPQLEDKALKDIRILNLYAGIGGNRKLWSDKPDVTAVEWNEEIATAYGDLYPGDEVVVGDAHEYLLDHFEKFDIIWASPPCPTHSQLRKNLAVETGADPVYPDMRLYEEILFLKGYFDGKWVVENVDPWYEPLIEPQPSGRHMFWSNFELPDIDTGATLGRDGESVMDNHDTDAIAIEFGYDPERLREYDFPSDYPRDKVINNMVHPKVGKAILESAIDSDV
jgi:DNA (cytosine-5)-methyltransferase 1